jgi:hypothetical protein
MAHPGQVQERIEIPAMIGDERWVDAGKHPLDEMLDRGR